MARLMKAPLCGVCTDGAFSIDQWRSVLRKSHEEGMDWLLDEPVQGAVLPWVRKLEFA